MPPSFRDLKSLYILFRERNGKIPQTYVIKISQNFVCENFVTILELALEDPRCYHLPPINGLGRGDLFYSSNDTFEQLAFDNAKTYYRVLAADLIKC